MLVPMKVEGFAGGLTDSPINANPNQFEFGDNWLVEKTSQMYTRPGSVPFSVAFAQLPTGNQRVGGVFNFNEDKALVGVSGDRCFYFSAGWQELLTPTGKNFFSAGTIANRISSANWKGHLILTNDGGALPMKIFQDTAGEYKAFTLGLPKFLHTSLYTSLSAPTDEMIALGNEIKSQMLAHFNNVNYGTIHAVVDAGAGSSSEFLTIPDLATDNTLEEVRQFVDALIKAYTNHFADAVSVSEVRTYHPKVYLASGRDLIATGAPNIGLSFTSPAEAWLGLAKQLNEIRRNYNWHVSSFKGHVPALVAFGTPFVSDRVNAPSLLDVEQKPTLGTSLFGPLIAFVNTLKASINAHISDTNISHTTLVNFSGQPDTEDLVRLDDATDSDSLFELAVHCYCAYRDHNADAKLPIEFLKGQTHHTALSQNRIDGCYTPPSPYTAKGQVQSVKPGMFVGSVVTGGTNGDGFAVGTTVVSVDPATQDIIVSADNDGLGTADAFGIYAFSTCKYHSWYQQYIDVNFKTNSEKGDLVPFDFGFNVAIGSPGVLSGMLFDVATKFNEHDNNYGFVATGSTATSGIHLLAAGSHKIDPDTIPPMQNFQYDYAFCYAHEYKTLSGEIFVVRGSPLYAQKKCYYGIADSATEITDIPQFPLGTNDLGLNNYDPEDLDINSYDCTNIKLEIYRTINGGQVYYMVSSEPLGTTHFKDAISDTDLIANEKLYTNGGVLPNDPPPVCKFLHITQDGTPYYGSVSSTLLDGTTETILNRIQQGIIDSPDSAPGQNYVDLQDAVAGISSVRTIPIAFTKSATYRLEGKFDAQGQGSIVAVSISDRIGLVGSFSPVQVDGAVVFAGPDQFYMTDGYVMIPLCKPWPKTYANLVTAERAYNIQGTFDKLSNRVWWGVTQSGVENDSCVILDLNQPYTAGGCFTTASNYAYFAPTALCTFNGQIIRGDSRGYVFAHDEAYRSDPRLDLTGVDTDASLWGTRWIPFKYRGPAFDFGLSGFRKWCSVIETKFNNFGDASVQITGINDMGRTTGNCTPIRSRNWLSIINERRFFPAGSLYFALKQVEFTNGKVVLTNSDILGKATMTGNDTVTLDAGVFPADMVDHVISFEADGYVAEYAITAEDVLLGSLTAPGVPNALHQKWVIRGYPKTEKIGLQSYTLWSTQMGANQTTAGAESGANV